MHTFTPRWYTHTHKHIYRHLSSYMRQRKCAEKIKKKEKTTLLKFMNLNLFIHKYTHTRTHTQHVAVPVCAYDFRKKSRAFVRYKCI